MTIRLHARARCQSCDWTAAGTIADVDRASGKHTRKGHPTTVTITPCLSRECDCP